MQPEFAVLEAIPSPPDATTIRYVTSLQERLQGIINTFTTKQRELFELESDLLKPYARDVVEITSKSTPVDSSESVPNLPLPSQIFRLQTRHEFVQILNFTTEKLVSGGTTEEADHLIDTVSQTPYYASVHPNVLVFGRLSYITLYLRTTDPLACPLKQCQFRVQLLIRVLQDGKEIAVPIAMDEWRSVFRTIVGSIKLQIDLREWTKAPLVRKHNVTLPRLKHKADDFILQIHMKSPSSPQALSLGPAADSDSYIVLASLPRCRVIGSETKTPAAFLSPEGLIAELMLQIAEEVSSGSVQDKKQIAMSVWSADGYSLSDDVFTEYLAHLKKWKTAAENIDKWPQAKSKDFLEKKLGTWLQMQRKHAKALKAGTMDARKRTGMTLERLASLDYEMPGWRDENPNGNA